LVVGVLLFGCAAGIQSVDEDRAIGRDMVKQVEAGLGIVSDSTATQYLSEVGKRLAHADPYKTFDFSFSLVDQAVPNAFASPGGWTYYTRGFLMFTNTEAEMAAVMGHEMTHVNRRHTAKQLAKASRPRILALPGAIVGGIINENLGRLINAPANILGTAFIARYSRENEFEADRGGQELMALAGYDPQALGSILYRLERHAEVVSGEKRIPGFFDSHPSTPNRLEEIKAYAQNIQWARQPGVTRTSEEHLRNLDGLIVGKDPSLGLKVKDRFVHPALYFSMKPPEGWPTLNLRQAGVCISPNRDALMVLGILKQGSDPTLFAEALARAIYKKHGARPTRSEPVTIGGIPAHLVDYQDKSDRETMHIAFLYVAYRGFIYQLIALAPERYRKAIRGFVLSFRPPTKAEIDSIIETRLRVVSAKAGERLAQLSKRTGNAWDVKMTAVVNGIDSNQKLKEGQLIKIAVKQKYTGPIALKF